MPRTRALKLISPLNQHVQTFLTVLCASVHHQNPSAPISTVLPLLPLPPGPTPPVPAHSGAVVGCASDACNRLLVSAGLDGALRVWDFRAQTCKAEVGLGLGAAVGVGAVGRGGGRETRSVPILTF